MKKYALGLYEKSMPNTLSLKEKLKYTKKYGFDFLEVSIDETDEKLARLDFSKKERYELMKIMFEEGIFIQTMCLSGHRKYPMGSKDPSIREKSMRIMEKAIDLASDLGIKIIQLAGYDVYYEPSDEVTKAYFEKNLSKAVEMAAKKGIILAFETMETEFMNTITKALHYVEKVKSPYLQIYPDCGNVTNAIKMYNLSLAEDFQNAKGYIAALHLKETVPGKFREIPFGTGHVDFDEVIRLGYEMGVRRYTAEFWYTGNDDWEQVILQTKLFMDEKLK
ncbi:MAG: L-ribulose-5-phosphate 3-epimerase [Cellulosilyticaceae bacterium]